MRWFFQGARSELYRMQAPGLYEKEKPTLLFKVGDGLFVAEGGFLELDLVCDSVDSDVAVLGERNCIFGPNLAEMLGDHLLEDLALVVLGSGDCFLKELLGAEQGGIRHENHLLIGGGAEAERISRATGSLIQLADERHHGGIGDRHIDVPLELEAPDVLVGVCNGVVAVNQIHKKCSVRHSG